MVVFNGLPVYQAPPEIRLEGCFETMRAVNGHIPLWPLHYERLKKGLYFTGTREPQTLMEFTKFIPEGIQRVRLQVVKKGWVLQTEPWVPAFEPVCLATSVVRRKNTYTTGKLSQRDEYDKALVNKPDWADDMLMLDDEGHISETTRSNIFWIKNGLTYTPSDDCFPLQGVARSYFLNWYHGPVEKGLFVPGFLKSADVVWVSNAVRGLQWVQKLDDFEWEKPTEFFINLQKNFETTCFGDRR